MRLSTLGKTLLILGAVVGGATGVALALGIRLDQLPPWMITVGMYKLAFMAAAGLFAAGAILGRAAQRRSVRHQVTEDGDRAHSVLGPGMWEASERSAREADRVNRAPRRDEPGR